MTDYAALSKLVKTDQQAAFKALGHALNDDPKDARLLALMGQLFQMGDGYGIAYHLWDRSMLYDKDPRAAQAALNNKGIALLNTGRSDYAEEGAELIRRVLRKDPEDLAALNNLALYELHNGDYGQVIHLCEKSLALDPAQAEVYECRAYASLMLGRWEEGWKDWDHSLGTKYRPIEWGPEPYWGGEKGVKLHVRGEQGLGDEISFASILPDAIRDCEVTLECDKRLEGLFRRSFPTIPVHGTRRTQPGAAVKEEPRPWHTPHDARCLIGSLARHYRSKTEDFPGTPYLVADPERRVQWRALLDTLPGKKVGIAWTGGLVSTFSDRRSLTLDQLRPVLDIPGITFVSLQYKDPTKEIGDLPIKHWARATESQDYDDTAALVAELDLVISATTAVVHLCGALGKTCWVLAPKRARWFYQRKGKKIPWYRSVEMFRQDKDWPIAEVAERLRWEVT